MREGVTEFGSAAGIVPQWLRAQTIPAAEPKTAYLRTFPAQEGWGWG